MTKRDTPAQPSADRRAMIAKIHVARKQTGLDEDTYRELLERVTGHRTSVVCTDAQLGLVLAEFRRLGWRATAPANASDKPHVRMIYAIWGDIRPLLEDADDQALRGFVRRQTHSAAHPEGVDAPEWLNGSDAAKVIEGLKGWLARLRKAWEAVDG
jgi:phage gp16-like protein